MPWTQHLFIQGPPQGRRLLRAHPQGFPNGPLESLQSSATKHSYVAESFFYGFFCSLDLLPFFLLSSLLVHLLITYFLPGTVSSIHSLPQAQRSRVSERFCSLPPTHGLLPCPALSVALSVSWVL